MKKKIIFVITKSNWGGAQRYVYDIATSISKEYDVAVALGGEGVLREKLEIAGVRTISIPSLGRDIHAKNDMAAFVELWKLFRKERPDIVHVNSSKAGGLGALAARLVRVPRIVYTVHGWPYNEPIPAFSKRFRWLASLVTMLLVNRVITVANFDHIHSPLGLETTMVHNGVAPFVLSHASEARAEIEKRIGSSPQHLFGIIAELHKNKGVDILVEAMAAVPTAHLAIIGEGEDRALLKTLIEKRGLQDRVHLLGFIEDAARFLKAFDVFVLPSRKEGLPYAILEAGWAEVPVVAATVGGIPEIIDDQISGVLVPAYDAQALAKALHELMQSPRTRAHYAERLKEKVERYFSLRGMVEKTIKVYES